MSFWLLLLLYAALCAAWYAWSTWAAWQDIWGKSRLEYPVQCRCRENDCVLLFWGTLVLAMIASPVLVPIDLLCFFLGIDDNYPY